MKVIIEYSEEKGWTVKSDTKSTDQLGWDEMIGLVAALTMPTDRPCLHWMKTRKEHNHQRRYMAVLARRNNVKLPIKA